MNRFHGIVVGAICAASVITHAQAGVSGKWQGATASGRAVVLDVKVDKQQMTGTFALGPQFAEIVDGKIEDKARFSFKATVDGRTVIVNGRLLGDEIELSPQGVPNPVMLQRAK